MKQPPIRLNQCKTWEVVNEYSDKQASRTFDPHTFPHDTKGLKVLDSGMCGLRPTGFVVIWVVLTFHYHSPGLRETLHVKHLAHAWDVWSMNIVSFVAGQAPIAL